MPSCFPRVLEAEAGTIQAPNEIPVCDLTDGIVAASVPFIIESEAVEPGCYLALLGVLHLLPAS